MCVLSPTHTQPSLITCFLFKSFECGRAWGRHKSKERLNVEEHEKLFSKDDIKVCGESVEKWRKKINNIWGNNTNTRSVWTWGSFYVVDTSASEWWGRKVQLCVILCHYHRQIILRYLNLLSVRAQRVTSHISPNSQLPLAALIARIFIWRNASERLSDSSINRALAVLVVAYYLFYVMLSPYLMT